jgi:hypothetical protein
VAALPDFRNSWNNRATMLLNRIRAERQAKEGKKSGGVKGKRKKASNDQLDLPGIE